MESQMIFIQAEDGPALPLYPTTYGYWAHQSEVIRPEGFPDYQLMQVLDGKGELEVGGRSRVVGPGDVFVLYPDEYHRYTPISRVWELAWVSFRGREASTLLAYAGIHGSGIRRLKAPALLPALKELLEYTDREEQMLYLGRCKRLYALLLDLKGSFLEEESLRAGRKRLQPILTFIEENLHRPLTLEELSLVAGVSPQYLCRLFQQTLGIRPMAYINQQRINRSKQLMFSRRGDKMYAIANLSGFENISYFCAVFKRLTGMSPERFRLLHGIQE
ncbi:AraC family transcriptional regulator [Paenibacillus sp. NFR01]|uniref:AraC family transcriptional regulator n=1 Tax=Paenibacillus sp. NFR01 TaxID=1566279 RepID=UPI0008AAAE04|nr:AraC family transcriptional regulator [Paenibacillus sp. NFR01]SEU20347.1 AraC-type DNA-binding protein [Paenibacillus sp. NFR01]